MVFFINATIIGLCMSFACLGMLISFAYFNIPDLTTSGSFTMGAAILVLLLTHGANSWVAIPFVLIAGGSMGICTTLLYTKLNIDPLFAGLMMMTAMYSINLTLMGQSNVPLLEYHQIFDIQLFSTPLYNQLLISFLLMGIIFCTIAFLLLSNWGIALRAVGNNKKMAESFGICPLHAQIWSLFITNALAAYSGYLIAQYQHFADIHMGDDTLLSTLSVVFLSISISFFFQAYSLWMQLLSICIGSVLFQYVIAIALLIGMNPIWLKALIAILVILCVLLSKIKIHHTKRCVT